MARDGWDSRLGWGPCREHLRLAKGQPKEEPAHRDSSSSDCHLLQGSQQSQRGLHLVRTRGTHLSMRSNCKGQVCAGGFFR